MGTPDNVKSSAAPPALRCDLLARIKREPRPPRWPQTSAAVLLLLQALKARAPDVAAGPDQVHTRLRPGVPQQKGTPLVRRHSVKRLPQNDQAIPIEAQSPWHLRRLVDKVSWH